MDSRKSKLDASFLVKEDLSVKDAMRQIGEAGDRILFVINDDQKLLGSLTDGDIRRWVLSEGTLASDIRKVFNKDPICVKADYSTENVKNLMLKKKIPGIPVVDDKGIVKDVLIWSSVFGKNGALEQEVLDFPVVIMAGGKGSRLDPFTRILPKPLIPIGEKTILEIIMDRYSEYQVKEFYLSINHKSQMIKAYFEEASSPYKISYIEEDKPLGTAGSLKYLQDKVEHSLIVSNCDIIINANYFEMSEFHKQHDYDITIIGSFRHFTIPYGICHIENGGALTRIQEKPEYDYLVNTGMYFLKKDVLKLIPRDEFYNITDLINHVQTQGGRVGVFPIDSKSWIDIGQWDEYHKSIKALEVKHG